MTDQVEEQDVELEEEIVDEAHDPKNAEQQSLDANDKAEDAGKKAKHRKGDKKNSDPMQKAPAAPGAMKSEMSGMKPMMAKKHHMKSEDVQIDGDFSEDLNALVESEATLSNEFKAKTAVIFEAAVKSKIAEEINRLETEYQEQLDEEIQSTKEDLVEKVDSYLNYVVETWVEDNKLAIQSGLRTEIAENFMEKMKDLFTESYVDVPESKIDLVDELATANEELEEQYNEAVAKSMTLQEELSNYKREAIIREASKDLAETQVEKLTKLAESIEFETAEDFAAKVATLKESYFKDKSASSPISEEVDDDNDPIEISGSMADYVAALRKTIK